MNQQPAEKRVSSSAPVLDVYSIFRTIQGEGPFSGFRAMFVRLAGCNLQCPGCDTEYTKPKRDLWNVRSILSFVNERMPDEPCPDGHVRRRLVVITGGEPFRQPNGLLALCNALAEQGITVQIETNGTLGPLPNEGLSNWVQLVESYHVNIVCSPKTGQVNKYISDLVERSAFGAYKYVLDADHIAEDGLPTTALGHSAHPQLARPHLLDPSVPVYVQPMDAYDEKKNKRNLAACVESCQKFGYILCLQVHKIIGVL